MHNANGTCVPLVDQCMSSNVHCTNWDCKWSKYIFDQCTPELWMCFFIHGNKIILTVSGFNIVIWLVSFLNRTCPIKWKRLRLEVDCVLLTTQCFICECTACICWDYNVPYIVQITIHYICIYSVGSLQLESPCDWENSWHVTSTLDIMKRTTFRVFPHTRELLSDVMIHTNNTQLQ